MLRAMILNDMQETGKGEIVIEEIDPKTLSSMIHYIYTGDLVGDDLDVQMVACAANKYNLPGFIDLLCFKMKSEEVKSEYIADMLIAADQYDSQDLKDLALNKLRADRKILNDEGFRRKMDGAENRNIIFDLFNEL